MQARREQADDELLPDLARASDLEFSTYNSHHPAPIGRFGCVQCKMLLAALTHKSKGYANFKCCFWSTPPDSPKRRDLPTPCCYHQLLRSELLATSIFNETLSDILKLRNLIIKFVVSVSTWSHGTSSNLARQKKRDSAAGPPRYHLYNYQLFLSVCNVTHCCTVHVRMSSVTTGHPSMYQTIGSCRGLHVTKVQVCVVLGDRYVQYLTLKDAINTLLTIFIVGLFKLEEMGLVRDLGLRLVEAPLCLLRLSIEVWCIFLWGLFHYLIHI